jgi:hypothetical protein
MANIKPGMVYPTTSGRTQSALIGEWEELERIWNMVEQGREEARRAALRATAPPLSFGDHLYNTEESQS